MASQTHQSANVALQAACDRTKTDPLSAGRLATAQSAYCRALKKCAEREIRVKDWEGCIDAARRRTDRFSVSRDGPMPSQIFICAERVLPCPQKLRRARNQWTRSRGLHRRRGPGRSAPKLFSTSQAVDSDRPRTSAPRRLSLRRCPASASHDTRPEPTGTSVGGWGKRTCKCACCLLTCRAALSPASPLPRRTPCTRASGYL